MRWLVRKSQSVDLEQYTRGLLRAIEIHRYGHDEAVRAAQCGPARRHLGDALSRKSTTHAFHDAKHLCKGQLDTWARPEGKTTNSPTGRRPRRCWSAKSPEDDGTAHTFDARHLQTDPSGHLEHGRKTVTAGPRLEPPGDDKYMPTSYIWDSGQEIAGVQGVVAGGVQFLTF